MCAFWFSENIIFTHLEGFQKAFQEFISIVNPLSILANDPNHGCSSFWLIQSVQVLTKSSNDGLILVGIFPKDVLDDHNSFLDNIIDFGLDQIQKSRYTSFCGLFHFDGASADSPNGLPDKINIDFRCISVWKYFYRSRQYYESKVLNNTGVI